MLYDVQTGLLPAGALTLFLFLLATAVGFVAGRPARDFGRICSSPARQSLYTAPHAWGLRRAFSRQPFRLSHTRRVQTRHRPARRAPVLACRTPDVGKEGGGMTGPFRRRRILAAGAAFIAVLCVYAVLLVRMQVTDADAYRAEAEKRVTRTVTLSAPQRKHI